jgi:hypothetical protein
MVLVAAAMDGRHTKMKAQVTAQLGVRNVCEEKTRRKSQPVSRYLGIPSFLHFLSSPSPPPFKLHTEPHTNY